MRIAILFLAGLALAPLGGCVGAPGPDPGRTVRVPTTHTGGGGPTSTLILGVQ